MKRILIVTRDLSYPGGTEKYLLKLIDALSKNEDIRLGVVELEGSNKFSNICAKLEDVEYFSFKSYISNKVILVNTDQIQWLHGIVQDFIPDIIHSALFSADIACLTIKHGSSEIGKVLIPYLERSVILTNLHKSLSSLKLDPVSDSNIIFVTTQFSEKLLIIEYKTKDWRIISEIVNKNISDVVLKLFDELVSVLPLKFGGTILIPCSIFSSDEINHKILSTKKQLLNARWPVIESAGSSPFKSVTISRIEPGKGVEFLCEMAKKHKFRLKVIGDGTNLNILKKKYRNTGISFLGKKDFELIKNELEISDAYINNSATEGFSLSIQEALMYSMRVLVTDIPGNKILFEDGKFIYKYSDEALFIDSLGRLKQCSEQTVLKLKIKRLKKLLEYSFETTVRMYVDIYMKKTSKFSEVTQHSENTLSEKRYYGSLLPALSKYSKITFILDSLHPPIQTGRLRHRNHINIHVHKPVYKENTKNKDSLLCYVESLEVYSHTLKAFAKSQLFKDKTYELVYSSGKTELFNSLATAVALLPKNINHLFIGVVDSFLVYLYVEWLREKELVSIKKIEEIIIILENKLLSEQVKRARLKKKVSGELSYGSFLVEIHFSRIFNSSSVSVSKITTKNIVFYLINLPWGINNAATVAEVLSKNIISNLYYVGGVASLVDNHQLDKPYYPNIVSGFENGKITQIDLNNQLSQKTDNMTCYSTKSSHLTLSSMPKESNNSIEFIDMEIWGFRSLLKNVKNCFIGFYIIDRPVHGVGLGDTYYNPAYLASLSRKKDRGKYAIYKKIMKEVYESSK